MNNIGIIDADLISRTNHRHPNLACMKLSGYYKLKGYDVELVTNYRDIPKYEKVFISKVFTDTKIPQSVFLNSNVEYGGTGFFFDRAAPLPYMIEHHMPDYHLYDDWIEYQRSRGFPLSAFDDYHHASIGYLTRGCTRQCSFCVNRNARKVVKASELSEFYDPTRKWIYLWDDNFLAYSNWEEELNKLKATGKPFKFRQGLDLRLMTDEKANAFKNSKYLHEYVFAFDDIREKEIIKEKLTLWKKYIQKETRLYVFCGYDRRGVYDDAFWIKDLVDTFERIKILMEYGCLSYIMRHEDYLKSPYKGMYITLARWCNQPSFFRNKSLREFCYYTKGIGGAARKYIDEFERLYPEIATAYYDMKYKEIRRY